MHKVGNVADCGDITSFPDCDGSCYLKTEKEIAELLFQVVLGTGLVDMRLPPLCKKVHLPQTKDANIDGKNVLN